MTKPIYNVVSMSGGKDSTALAIVALERNTPNLRFLFADTGNEHAQTYEYVEYLRRALGIDIETVRADYSARIERKRKTVETKWRDEGVREDLIERALSVLHPTGNPFLDCCIYHGRFPSSKVRFCSQELKQEPMIAKEMEIGKGAQAVISWQGVRADESPARRDLPERDVEFGTWEPEPRGLLIYRPIIAWTVDDVFAAHRRAGIEPNPLYAQGMSRVGCMPCIHARKAELREIAARFPDEIARIAEWERIVAEAGKKKKASFFHFADGRGENINQAVEWSRTTRGGSQYDLLALAEEPTMCSSVYGLCE